MSAAIASRRSYRSRALLASLLVACCGSAAVIAACGDDDDNAAKRPIDSGVADVTVPDAGDAGGDAPTDAGADAAALARGKYLVDHVAACGDCHTPRLPTGAPDMANYLSGVDCFLDGLPTADGGCIASANLTNDATGLKNLTDAQIKAMFLDGKTPDGKAVVPVMPYYVFHNMTADDANAIVAYLRTVPAVAHKVAAPEAPFDNVPVPAAPIDPAARPSTGAGPFA